MSDVFSLTRGDGPLLLSIPHAGTGLPPAIASRLTDAALRLPDTDWHVPQLYAFATEIGASVITAQLSRYVIDLNRPPTDESLYPGQATTGLVPLTQFDGTPIYRPGAEPDAAEITERRSRYWLPYHEAIKAKLAAIKARHGYAILWDCHSIASRVPRLFDGTLPDLNLGTAHGTSAAPAFSEAVAREMAQSGYSHVVNGRFVGGHITRSFGRPQVNIHALQMEIGWDAYIAPGPDYAIDAAKAAKLSATLNHMLSALLAVRPAV